MAYTLDQSYNPTVNGDFNLRFASNNTVKTGQSFVPSVTAPVNRVELNLKRLGTPSGNIWVTIEADSAGDASGTPLATSSNVVVDALSTSYATIQFDFSSAVTLTASTTYWIVLQGDYSFSNANNIIQGTNSAGAYAGGLFDTYNGTSWDNRTGYDAWFNEYYGTSGGSFLLNFI